jgi:hypothetical protein
MIRPQFCNLTEAKCSGCDDRFDSLRVMQETIQTGRFRSCRGDPLLLMNPPMAGDALSPLTLVAQIQLAGIDWAILIGFFTVTLGIGLWCARQAGRSSGEFFLSGRHMPWWLLGFSMVATTFSTDTPNLVTDFVRKVGVSDYRHGDRVLLCAALAEDRGSDRYGTLRGPL